MDLVFFSPKQFPRVNGEKGQFTEDKRLLRDRDRLKKVMELNATIYGPEVSSFTKSTTAEHSNSRMPP